MNENTTDPKHTDLITKLVMAALDVVEHTKATSFIVPLPCTSPALEVVVQPAVDMPQRRALDARPDEPLNWEGKADALYPGYVRPTPGMTASLAASAAQPESSALTLLNDIALLWHADQLEAAPGAEVKFEKLMERAELFMLRTERASAAQPAPDPSLRGVVEDLADRLRVIRGLDRFHDVSTACGNAISMAESALAAPAAPAVQPVAAAVPEGWKLVPVAPTGEMLRAAGYRASAAGVSTTGQEVYAAMLAAAPAAPATSEG